MSIRSDEDVLKNPSLRLQKRFIFQHRSKPIIKRKVVDQHSHTSRIEAFQYIIIFAIAIIDFRFEPSWNLNCRSSRGFFVYYWIGLGLSSLTASRWYLNDASNGNVRGKLRPGLLSQTGPSLIESYWRRDHPVSQWNWVTSGMGWIRNFEPKFNREIMKFYNINHFHIKILMGINLCKNFIFIINLFICI